MGSLERWIHRERPSSGSDASQLAMGLPMVQGLESIICMSSRRLGYGGLWSNSFNTKLFHGVSLFLSEGGCISPLNVLEQPFLSIQEVSSGQGLQEHPSRSGWWC